MDSYLNTPRNSPNASKLYLTDDKLREAIENCIQHSSGADGAQRKEAYTELLSDLNNLADVDMAPIQDRNSFYSFDRQRAKDEIAYRQALKKELDFIGDDVGRLGGLMR